MPATGEVAAAFAFSEGTGSTTADFSGNSNTGTLINGPAWSPAGRYGDALLFDGFDDAVVVPHSSSLDLGASVMLEAWIHPTATVPTGTILRKDGASGSPYALGLTAEGRPYVTVTTSAGATTFYGPNAICSSAT
jgi:hypothetical protein